MSTCVCSFLRGLWSFLLGSLRIILFFSNLILLVIAAVITTILFQFSHNGNIDLLPKTFLQTEVLALSVLAILIALIAIVGSFHLHEATLKVSMALSIIYVLLVMTLIINTSSGSSLDKDNKIYMDWLKSYQPFYAWNTSEPEDPRSLYSTKTWDRLQSRFCCGIDGPEDWIAYRPKSLPTNSFPKSCCAPGDRFVPFVDNQIARGEPYCLDNSALYRLGCRQRVEIFEDFLLSYGLFMVALQLVLAAISYCVCHKKEKHDYTPSIETLH